MPTEFCQVVMTAGNAEEAAALAHSAVEARLAACAQVGGPIESVYRWQGEVMREAEWRVTFKTTLARYPELEQHLRERHSYDVPEIVCVPIIAGSPDYLQWIAGNV